MLNRYFLVVCVFCCGPIFSLNISRRLSSLPLSPAQVFYIRIPPKSYTVNCPLGETCRYESVLQPKIQRDLAMKLSIPRNVKIINEESRGGKKGRSVGLREEVSLQKRWKKKEEYKMDKYKKTKRELKKYWKKAKENTKTGNVNLIKLGEKPPKKNSELTAYKWNENNKQKILKPNINYVSNARPSHLKWRELVINEIPIVKSEAAYDIRSSSSSRKKYRSQDVQVPSGRSRSFVGKRISSPLTKISRLRLTGLPSSIISFTRPLTIRRLQKTDYWKNDNYV